MSFSNLLVAVSLLSACGGSAAPIRFVSTADGPMHAAINERLDTLHETASKADGSRYFECFHPDAVFLGTDASERWPIAAFKEYGQARFDTGVGWTYTVEERNIELSSDGRYAVFDELLHNARLGHTRGTGILILDAVGHWEILQYNLTFTVPNERAEEVASLLSSKPANAPAPTTDQ